MDNLFQQANQQGTPRRNSQGSAGVSLQRSNSAHEKVDTAQAIKASADKQDRNSVTVVSHVKSDKLSVKPKPLVNGDKADSKKETQSSIVQIKPLKPVNKHVDQINRTSLEVKPSKPDSKSTQEQVQSSVAEAKNKFGGVTPIRDPMQNKNNSTQLNVLSNVNRSQTFAGVDTKRMSNGLQYDGNKTDFTLGKESSNINKENTKSDKTPAVNGNHSVVKETVKIPVTSNPNSLGPMASQKKFLSTSTGSLQDLNKPKPEVVKGLQPTKHKSILVMSEDKQLMDLDSFTTRKNMLDEIKKFDKELKHTKTRDSRDTKLTEIGSSSGGFYKVAEKKSEEPDHRNKLMNDIKLSKKPSEIKSAKEEQVVNKNIKSETKDSNKDYNKVSKVKVDIKPAKEQIHPEAANRNKQSVEIKMEANKDAVSQLQKFDDLLDTVDGESISYEKQKQDEKLPVVTVIDQPREVVTEKGDATTTETGQITNESESSADDRSDASEDERYITKFQFHQPKVKEDILSKPHKKGKFYIIVELRYLESAYFELPLILK